MSAVSRIPARKNEREHIAPNSLLEHLYTRFPLTDLQAMLEEKPKDSTLLAWNVNSRDYRAIVQRAIEFVLDD